MFFIKIKINKQIKCQCLFHLSILCCLGLKTMIYNASTLLRLSQHCCEFFVKGKVCLSPKGGILESQDGNFNWDWIGEQRKLFENKRWNFQGLESWRLIRGQSINMTTLNSHTDNISNIVVCSLLWVAKLLWTQNMSK